MYRIPKAPMEALIERYLCQRLKCSAETSNGVSVREFVLRVLKATNSHPREIQPASTIHPRGRGFFYAIYLIDLMYSKNIRVPDNPCVLFALALMMSHKISLDDDEIISTRSWTNSLLSGYITHHDFLAWERSVLRDLDHNLELLGMKNLIKYCNDWTQFFDDGGPGDIATRKWTAGSAASAHSRAISGQAAAYPAAHARWYMHPNYPQLPGYSSWTQHHYSQCPSHPAPSPGYSAPGHSVPPGYSAPGHSVPPGYSARSHSVPPGYSAPGHSVPPGYSAPGRLVPPSYSTSFQANSMVHVPRPENLWSSYFAAEYYYPTQGRF